MNFIERSLKHKQVTLSILLLFFVFGVYSLLNMSRREDPKITIRQGLVIAYYPGANSSKVEEQVTKKLEEHLFKFEEVRKEKTYSTSQDGFVVINVELNENITEPDIFWSKLRQQLALAKQLDLPDGVIGPIVNSDFGDTEAMILGISGKGVSYEQLKEYAQRLEDILRPIASVSKIKLSGELEEEIIVSTNSAKLAQHNIDQQNIIKVLQSQNDVFATGDLNIDSYKVPLYAKGYYNTIEELGDQIVGTSKTGSVVRLKDIANLKRGYVDPSNKIKINNRNAIIVSIQMLSGKNIVKFGEEVAQKLEIFKKTTPSNVEITTIADQPQIVDHNISHFIREFFLAIAAVIIVIIIMLPLRIALVAAMAIPMTVALTLALMNMFGIELHQVSLAALIVVLGLVVDDAIVVADNYVELLDKKYSRWKAAWKSASELIVPISVATITIIFAFMPMIIITGSVGEFIRALPLTVTISLTASFIVAMVLTPLLCYTFINKGLKDHNKEGHEQKMGLIDKMQLAYNSALDWCVAHSKIVAIGSIIPLILAILLFLYGVKEKFFPAAERNQFVIELWMPTGTRLHATEAATYRLENLIKKDKRVTNYTSFIGSSAPRFYYNFSPEFPVENYSQIVVNTIDIESTEDLVKELESKIESAVPEGNPQIKLLQQGTPLKASIEVRIWGDNVALLKEIGDKIAAIIKSKPEHAHVINNFGKDYYGIDIRLKPEAERLGFTTEMVAKNVYAGFKGAPITTIREGKNAVKVVFRLDEEQRQSISDMLKTYISSPVSGAKVPLEQIATLVPVWSTGKIVHRNGIKVLTVQSETKDDVLPSQLLEDICPEIEKIQLPLGYEISYGGEYESQNETLPEMIKALSISLLLIFFITLIQFKNIREALIVMSTIPLSMLGAILGLLITGNNFGFTAFIGFISLSGVVVRNAIILIDHIHELVKNEGMSLEMAVIESGKRRLRPIFLTAMAAAIGVLPMILSGSQLWSPLASVIAFGVVFSMIIALLTVPIFYMLWIVPKADMISNNLEN